MSSYTVLLTPTCLLVFEKFSYCGFNCLNQKPLLSKIMEQKVINCLIRMKKFRWFCLWKALKFFTHLLEFQIHSYLPDYYLLYFHLFWRILPSYALLPSYRIIWYLREKNIDFEMVDRLSIFQSIVIASWIIQLVSSYWRLKKCSRVFSLFDCVNSKYR